MYPHTATPPIQTPLTRLRESLRPPWLDGLPLGPIQSLRHRTNLLRERIQERYRLAREEGIWIGGQGRKTREESMERWRDAFRERLVKIRGNVTPLQEEQVQHHEHIDETSQDDTTTTTTTTSPDPQQLLELPRHRLARLAHEAREQSRNQGSHRTWFWWWPSWTGTKEPS